MFLFEIRRSGRFVFELSMYSVLSDLAYETDSRLLTESLFCRRRMQHNAWNYFTTRILMCTWYWRA